MNSRYAPRIAITILGACCLLTGCLANRPFSRRWLDAELAKRDVDDYYVDECEDGVTVVIDGTNFTDLALLADLPIAHLGLYGTGVRSLDALPAMRLKSLTIATAPVEDISPLSGTDLRDLELRGTRVSDLSPLKGMKLRSLSFSPMLITNGWDVVRQMTSLELLCSQKVEQFWNNWDGARPPEHLIAPHMDITGSWYHTDGRYFGTDMTIRENDETYWVTVHAWGYVVNEHTKITARFSNGVLRLAQRIQDAWPLWYDTLYAVEIGAEQYLVPASVAHELVQSLSCDGSTWADKPAPHVLQRK